MKKIFNKKLINYIPFLVLFVIMFLLHFNTRIFNDDLFFGSILNENNLFSWLGTRWNTWTSRLILETLEVIFDTININFWRICNSFMFVLLAYSISRIFSKGDLNSNKKICTLILIYPFLNLYSAGWVSTTIVYLWTGALGLFSLIPLKNEFDEIKTSKIQYILSFLALMVAINQEQMCCLILGFSLVSFFMMKKENKKTKYSIFLMISSIISLIIIMLCPGNSLRSVEEVTKWYPAYSNFNILDKIYLGLVPTVAAIIKNKILIIILCISLSYGFYKNKANNFLKTFSLIITGLVLLLTVFKNNILSSFEYIDLFINILNMEDIPNFALSSYNLYLILPLIFSIFLIISLTILIFNYFKDEKRNLIYPIIFLGGFASKFMMGLSPTIFASGDRTTFYFYIVIIILIYLILNKIKNKKDEVNYVYVVIIIIAILNVINIINNMIFIGI
jgi:hypothetical protein